ncbi:MAG: hypothetical protein DYG98_02295 [Haliscomenobacteraceae bacterium CHB4]|nr:hypothetical protein [Haliscomenobacteraceae bacterium CHB4]
MERNIISANFVFIFALRSVVTAQEAYSTMLLVCPAAVNQIFKHNGMRPLCSRQSVICLYGDLHI